MTFIETSEARHSAGTLGVMNWEGEAVSRVEDSGVK